MDNQQIKKSLIINDDIKKKIIIKKKKGLAPIINDDNKKVFSEKQNIKKKIYNKFIMKDSKSIFKTSFKIPIINKTKFPLKIMKKFTKHYLGIDESIGFNEYSTKIKYRTFKKIINENKEVTGYENIQENNFRYSDIGNKINWGIITGSKNKLYIFDLDCYKEKWEKYGNNHPFIKHYQQVYDLQLHDNYLTNIETIISKIDTFSVKTGKGGYHLYFNYNTNTNLARKCCEDLEFDFLGEGGFCMGYNSVVNDNKYEVINDTEIKYFNESHEDFYNILITHNLNDKQKEKKLKKIKKHKTQKNHKMDMTLWDYDLDDETWNQILHAVQYFKNKYFQGKHKDYCYDNFLKITTFFKFFNKKDDWIKLCKIDKNYNTYEQKNNILWNSIDIEEVKNKYQPKCIVSIILFEINKYHLLSNIKYRKLLDNYIKPDLVVDSSNTKGLSEVFSINPNKNYIIKSKTNTGKTYLVNKFHHHQDKPIISITSRVSLAKEHKQVFLNMNKENEDTDYLLYNDENLDTYFNNYEGENMVIQLDSLLKIKNWDFTNYIIFIDELQSVFEYLDTSTTLKNKRKEVEALFIDMLKSCHQFIGVDADIQDSVLHFFNPSVINDNHNEIAINKEFVFVENLYSPYKDVEAEEIYDYKILMDLVSKEEQFMLCCDSATECHNIKNYLSNKYPDKYNVKEIVIIDRLYDTKNDEMDLDEISMLIFSPKIIYGLDSTLNRKVFCIFKGHTIPAKAMLQQISRCRNPEKIYFHWLNKDIVVKDFEFNSTDEVIDRVQYLNSFCNKYKHVSLSVEETDNLRCPYEKFYNDRMLFHLYNSDSDLTNRYKHFKLGLKRMDIKVLSSGCKKSIKLHKKTTQKITQLTIKELEEHFLDNKDSEYYQKINEILKIDNDDKEKFKTMFINTYALQQHLNYINFFKKSDSKSIKKIKELMESNYNFNVSLSDENKISWLKSTLDLVGFDYVTFNFEKDLQNPEKYFNEYSKLFRNRTIKSFDNQADFQKAIKTAFDQLFSITPKQSIFRGKSKEKTIDKKRYRYTEYRLNKDIYDYHLTLLKYRETEEVEEDICLI